MNCVRQRFSARLSIVLSITCWLSGGCGDRSTAEKSSEAKTKGARKIAQREAPVRPAGVLPRFTDVTASSGVRFERDDDMRGHHRILEANGGGAAIFDYDNDNRPDLLFTSGCRIPFLPEGGPASIGLFRNLGGRFEPTGDSAGMARHGFFYGCTVGDYNNDGFDDCYVTAFGANALWQNNGDGTFSEQTAVSNTGGNSWSSSAAFADFNDDGNLDLFVANYVEYSARKPRLCPDRSSPDGYTQCSPTLFHGAADVLLIADGSGGFRDVTVKSGITGKDGKGLGVVVFDATGDRRPDIFVANDGVPNFLYVNRPTENSTGVPTFQEMGMLHGVAVNGVAKAEGCMGIACGDYNGDGRMDLYVTNFYAERNTLYRNNDHEFVDVTSGSGAGAPTRPMVGWGTLFADFDNDATLELFVTNGHVDDFSWRKKGAEPYQMRPMMFRYETTGRFREISNWCGDYFQKKWLGRGAVVGDLDGDGDLDLVVSHQRSPAAVLRNDTPTKHRSALLKLVGTGRSNRNAIGARVEVIGFDRKCVREIVGGGSYQSASDYRVHIGLGKKSMIPRVRILWPSGRTEELSEVPAGVSVVIEGQGLLRVISR